MNRLLLLLLLSPLCCPAQSMIDTLHWSAERRLRLSDFHSPAQPGLGGSEFYYQIGYEVRPTSVWSQPAIDDFCLMFRNLSWVSETARNERTLAYNQVLFDLVEVHTRQMKAKLITLSADRRFKQQAKQIEYLTNAELGAEVNRFRAETGGGDDLPMLQQWQKQVMQRLYSIPDLITTYRASKFGYGLFFGGGVAVPTGPLATLLNTPSGVALGLDFAIGRTMIFLNPTLYNGTIRSGFSFNSQSWETAMPVRPSLFELSLGRIVHDSPRSRLIPYLGYRLFSLMPRDENDARYQGFSMLNYGPTAGLAFDVKLGDNMPQPDRSEESFWFIRTKIAYTPVLTAQPFTGGLISVQLGLGGFGRIRKVNYRPEPTLIPIPPSLL